VLNREFGRETPDSAWCADITYIPTGAGWVYLAVVLDLATRLVVGWSMATHMRTDLVTSALKNALAIRKPANEIIHHSDRGSQYASDEYQDLLNAHGILCSMSRVGNCWDNAVMESFFGTFKQEWANLQRWRGLDDAKLSTFEFIDVFYNRERLHSSLGYMTPAEADAAAA
jgi:transposase InsO family protein